ncbi:hypothetical protein L1987_16507 [Smallanthus sonchifolius]|uniref:Uncharacterized protein n=1 Tax=Smallanthus sonchifolius TaxID=185202 RepID=A0ACB9J8X6_9ASTR|nr:hypothetical protein L1987_16507 [Smallanthus sonchifolius]
MTENDYYVLFGPKDVQIFKEFETTSTPIMSGQRTNTVYVLNAESTYVKQAKGNQSADIWHQRLGHVGLNKMELMVNQDLVNGLPKVKINKDVICPGCQFGKATQLPFPQKSKHKSEECLELVHSDVFGPVKQPSIQGLRYMVTFIDDFSHYVWVYFLKEKSQVFEKFREFEVDAEILTGKTVRGLRSDNGGEYLATDFSNYLKQKRIRRQLTCSNTPQQNGVSERKNRHLGEVTRSLLHGKNLPGRFWAEAMYTSAFIINQIPSQGMKYISPFEKLTGLKPNVKYFKVFGCVCYVFVPNHLRHKLEKRAVRCIFVGYDAEKKGWRCCDPNNGRIYVSRHVIFDENSAWWSENSQMLPDSQELKEDLESANVQLSIGSHDDTESEPVESSSPENEVTTIDESSQSDFLPRRSQRVRKPNPRYASANVAIVESRFIEPETFGDAIKQKEWRLAMEEEILALKRNQTWELVPQPTDVNLVSCKWVYKLKRKADGSIERFKARLVARGFSQQYGLDYEDTFSPVAKLTTIRVLLAVATCKKWRLWQMDVNNAFLYGDLDHVIYMTQPLGFESENHPEYVCKLKKAIYGLKQSPRAWFGKIGEFLELNGFRITNSDTSLFVKQVENRSVVVLVYVDDLIITGDHEEEIDQLKANLCVRFKMKDIGRLKHFLGLEVKYLDDQIILHQTKYASEVLFRFEMTDCKPSTTPIDPNMKVRSEDGRELEDPSVYRKIVGSLIYLTLTRPDISFAVGIMSRFMQNPKKPHLIAVRRILKYVKATVNFGLRFKRETNPKLVGYCDSDYAGDLDTRRSTTGYVFMFGSGAISWCSKRQPTVSLSTTESEYRAAAMAAQECTWLVQLLEELHQKVTYQVKLMCDNVSAIKLAKNPVFHARTKHIEVHYHFIREKVLKGEIEMVQVGTKEQVADLFTNGLSSMKLLGFVKEMGIIQVGNKREC